MNKYINIYNGDVTLGQKDGTMISNGDDTFPIKVTLNAREVDYECMLMAIRTEAGYAGYDTVISFTGQTASKWFVAKDEGFEKETVNERATWGSTISFDTVADTNSLFWIKAISTAEELPLDDKTVKVNIKSTIGSVA